MCEKAPVMPAVLWDTIKWTRYILSFFLVRLEEIIHSATDEQGQLGSEL
jgi:hypothetical protein